MDNFTRIDLPDYKGYKNFMIYHNDGMNEWYCGYAVLPEDHILYDKQTEFDDIIMNIDVHGRVTYMKDHEIGFDCNHFGDDIISCNEDYVINQIHEMIDQLEKMKIMNIYREIITKNEYQHLIRKMILTECKHEIERRIKNFDSINSEDILKVLINDLNNLLKISINIMEENKVEVPETFKRMKMFTYMYSPLLESFVILYPELYYEFMKGI